MRMGSSDWSDVFATSLKEFPDWGFSDSYSGIPVSTIPSLDDYATADLYSPMGTISLGINSTFDGDKSNNSFNLAAGEIQPETFGSQISASEEIASLLSCDYNEDFMPSNYFCNGGDFCEQDKMDRNVSNPCGIDFLNCFNGSYNSSTAIARPISNKESANWYEKDNVEDIGSNLITQFAIPANNDNIHLENTMLTNCILKNRIETDHSDQHESLNKEASLLSTPNKFGKYRSHESSSVKHLLHNERLDKEHQCLGCQCTPLSDYYNLNSFQTFSSGTLKGSFLPGCQCEDAKHAESCMQNCTYSDETARNSVSPSQFLNDISAWSERSIDHYNNNFNDNEKGDHSTISTDLNCKDADNLHQAVTSQDFLSHDTKDKNYIINETISDQLMFDVNNNKKSQFTRSHKVRIMPHNNSVQNSYLCRKITQTKSLYKPLSEKELPIQFRKKINTTFVNSIEFEEIKCGVTSEANRFMRPKIQTIILKRIKVKTKKKFATSSQESLNSKNGQSDQLLHSDTKSDISSMCQAIRLNVGSNESMLVVGSSQSQKTILNNETRWQPILPALPKNQMKTQSSTPITFLVPAINQQPKLNHLLPVTLPSIPINCSTEVNPAVAGSSAVTAVDHSINPQLPQAKATSFTSSSQPLQLQSGSDNIKIQDGLPSKNKSPYLSSTYNRSRTRPSFSVLQLKILQRRFERSQYIPKHEIGELATLLELSQMQVKMWFQNRRSKYKKLLRRAMDQNTAKKKVFATEINDTQSDMAPTFDSVAESSIGSESLMTYPVQKAPKKVSALKIQPKIKDISKHRIFEDLEDNLTLRNRTAPAHPNSYGKMKPAQSSDDETENCLTITS